MIRENAERPEMAKRQEVKQSKRPDSFERSQLRLKMKHLQNAVKIVHKFRAMVQSFVWNNDNRKLFQKMDVDCIELIDYFRKEEHKTSDLLCQGWTGKIHRSLIVTKLSDL